MMDDSPDLALRDAPPAAEEATDYDWAHRICYLRLLDAEAAGADWRDVASTVLKLDLDADPGHARSIWASHLARAQWMTAHGYRDYLSSSDGADYPST